MFMAMRDTNERTQHTLINAFFISYRFPLACRLSVGRLSADRFLGSSSSQLPEPQRPLVHSFVAYRRFPYLDVSFLGAGKGMGGGAGETEQRASSLAIHFPAPVLMASQP